MIIFPHLNFSELGNLTLTEWWVWNVLCVEWTVCIWPSGNLFSCWKPLTSIYYFQILSHILLKLLFGNLSLMFFIFFNVFHNADLLLLWNTLLLFLSRFFIFFSYPRLIFIGHLNTFFEASNFIVIFAVWLFIEEIGLAITKLRPEGSRIGFSSSSFVFIARIKFRPFPYLVLTTWKSSKML